MIELTLAEQVWLMVAAPNTGRPRGATLGVTTDVAVFLELLAGGAVTKNGVLDQMRAVMADDPLAVRLADAVTLLTGPGTLLSLPHS